MLRVTAQARGARTGGGSGNVDTNGGALRPARLSAARVLIGGEEFVLLEWTTAPSSTAALLPRAEAEVAHLMLDGARNAAIATARGRDLGTIAKQVSNAFRKLGVRSRSELFAKVAAASHPLDATAP